MLLGEFPPRASETGLESLDLIDDEDGVTPVPEFYISKLRGPPSFPDHSDNEEHDLLDECFKRDVVWSLASSIAVLYGIIASGSSKNAFNGRHYHRNMRLHKESFNAQFRAEKITSGFSKIDPNLQKKLPRLRSAPSPETMEDVIVCPAFELLFQKIVQVEDGTECCMTVSYLKDFSLLLALVSAVRDKDLSRHLQAERVMLSLCFAFDHINYARYMSFQHVNLHMLEKHHDPAFTE